MSDAKQSISDGSIFEMGKSKAKQFFTKAQAIDS